MNPNERFYSSTNTNMFCTLFTFELCFRQSLNVDPGEALISVLIQLILVL